MIRRTICLMDNTEFKDHNEEFSRKFDVEEYLEKSNFIIRFIELGRIRSIINAVNDENVDTVLDVGCGNAFLLEKLKAKKSFGVDLSLNNIIKAQRRLKDKGFFLLLRANAENLPLEKAKFDAVICTEVIEHVQNPETVLKEITRVLKEDGIFIITIPNDTLINKLKKVLKVTGLQKLLSIEYGGAEEWHIHVFTRKSMNDLLIKYGFRIERAWGFPYSFLPLHYIFQCKKQD